MDKIAKPHELQAELRRLLAYCSGPEKPSRERMALELRTLADRMAGDGLLEEFLSKVLKALIIMMPSLSGAKNLLKKEGFEKADLKKNVEELHEAATKYLKYHGVR